MTDNSNFSLSLPTLLYHTFDTTLAYHACRVVQYILSPPHYVTVVSVAVTHTHVRFQWSTQPSNRIIRCTFSLRGWSLRWLCPKIKIKFHVQDHQVDLSTITLFECAFTLTAHAQKQTWVNTVVEKTTITSSFRSTWKWQPLSNADKFVQVLNSLLQPRQQFCCCRSRVLTPL